ncbi:MAG: sensor histidine kinase [Anaerolineae bacterium]
MERKVHIEPGLLPVFRLLTAIRLALTALASLEGFGGGPFGDRQFGHATTVYNIIDVALLLGYLSWPRLQKWLGRAYLPLGILLASAGPILIQHLVRQPADPVGMWDVLRAWQLLPALLIPLFIVAWQYDFRRVLAFSIGTTVVDVILTRWLIPVESIRSVALSDSPYALMFFGVMGVLINRMTIFIAVGFMVTRLMRTQREQRAALLQANVKLTHYATTLEQLTTSRERNRLARELHDTLAHTLSALAVQLGAVDALWDTDEAEAQHLLEQSLAVTRTGLTETRRALHDLRASPLEDLGIALALRALGESAAARNGMAVDVEVPERLAALSPAEEQCLYRVAQEALENVSRHAAARRVTVRLDSTAEAITLTISDDGQGFDLAAADVEQRLGLRGMRERAEMVGGALAVESAPGQGTTVKLTIAISSQLSAFSDQLALAEG